MVRSVKIRGRWKPVEIDVTLIDQTQLQHLACFEELTEYDIIGGDDEKLKIKHEVAEVQKDTGKKIKKKKQRKKKKKVSNTESEATEVSVSDDSATDLQKKKISKASNKRKCLEGTKEGSSKRRKLDKDVEVESVVKEQTKDVDMSAWSGLCVPDEILRCLGEQGFSSPTPIQSLCLPPAIRDRLDIIGAAETGSGKTLAFAIPIINHILQEKINSKSNGNEFDNSPASTSDSEENTEDNNDNMSADDIENSESDNNSDIDNTDEANMDNDEANDEISDNENGNDVITSNQSPTDDDQSDCELDDNSRVIKGSKAMGNHLRALILLPTRELALQVRDHIHKITRYTDIRCVAIVGGMATQKQERLLRGRPEIVVATPGRLWELVSQGDEHLSGLSSIGYLVIDEADRMIEKGHFQEVTNIINILNEKPERASRRQTFVFSATLTFVHSKPHWLDLKKKRKKKSHQITTKEKLDDLVARIGFRDKPKVIDLTKKCGTADSLVESRISCAVEEKDFYLYYFIHRYPGRSLVFVNSKDSARRLVSVFTLLRCSPLPLHSDMHQRQRLKNLDRFKGNPRGMLIATDVAARGLDIHDVQHVIHYQVPQTTENYVHRSGRTARAQKEGLSVMLVSSDDIKNYNKIIKSLKRSDDIPMFPVELEYMNEVKARVNLARQIELQQHRMTKKKKQKDWFEQAAIEADIILDDDFAGGRSDDSDDETDGHEIAAVKQKLAELSSQLSGLLRAPLSSSRCSAKYPTKSGKLTVPYIEESGDKKAVSVVKRERRSSAAESRSEETRSDQLQKNKRKRRNRKKTKPSAEESSLL